MIKQYETVFIATPVLSDAQMKEAVAKYVGLIKENGGEVVYERRPLVFIILSSSRLIPSSSTHSRPSIAATRGLSVSSLSQWISTQSLMRKREELTNRTKTRSKNHGTEQRNPLSQPSYS